ncbi:hypothetical protein M8C21_020234 [Ambrosia artemisiifolia]|uniref:Uncharacterized protein n=1 Tax=Ambrosia artemisiifolia TaxID=4212 RepID=A0AAD5G2L8_AMBAR|nr:hypothetical protein M8C21_020234 [Ambrosia artemisiifolia]
MFWIDNWLVDGHLKDHFPVLFDIAKNKKALVSQRATKVGAITQRSWEWTLDPVQEQEWEQMGQLLTLLNNYAFGSTTDKWGWRKCSDSGFSVAKNLDVLDRNCQPKRSAYGLPKNKFIFGCFNQLYKMDPEIFMTWPFGYLPLPGWLVSGGDPCAEGWQGVQCVNSNITGIILNGANLGGELDENLGAFVSIIQIDLSNNHIGGHIPSSLPLTTKSLMLSGNQLTGSISDSLSLLGQMTDLHLQDNHLTGVLDVLQDLPLIALRTGNPFNTTIIASPPVSSPSLASFGPLPSEIGPGIQRKMALLKDYERSGKSSVFVDKQIGEQNEDLGEFDKAILRTQRELWMKRKENYDMFGEVLDLIGEMLKPVTGILSSKVVGQVKVCLHSRWWPF